MTLFAYPPVPVFTVGALTIRVWGIFVALGVVVATLLAARRASRFGIPSADIWNLAFWATLAGLFGARALYVVEYWRNFAAEPWRAIAVWEGGMSAFGALLLGVPVIWWYARSRSLSWRSIAAAVSPVLLLGDAIGRLGGAASHMYPGKPTAFPISYVLDGVRRHEVGMELALASLVGFLVVLGTEKFTVRVSDTVSKTRFSAFSLVLLLYSLERFFLDFLRAADLPVSDLRYAGLTLAQYLAAGGIVLGLSLGKSSKASS